MTDFAKLAAAAADHFTRALTEIAGGRFERALVNLQNTEAYSREALKVRGFYFVPEYRLEDLRVSVAKLNKRAEKLGQAPCGVVEHGCEIRARQTENGRWYELPYVLISASGSAPRVADATLLARVEHTEAGNIVACAPGIESQPEWREVDARCEHCNTRRKRIDTFVVETPAGVTLVGRNCLADFVRSTDVAGALQLWKIIAEFSRAAGEPSDDDWASYGGGRHYIDTERFIACAIRSVRAQGFKKSKEDGSTSSAAEFAAGRCPVGERSEADWKAAQPAECDWQAARDAVAWLKGDLTDKEAASDFIQNARVIVQLPVLKPRNYGLAAAIGWSYFKKTEHELAKRREREARKPSSHYGEQGKRYSFARLTVTLVRYFDGVYGTTTLAKLVDDEGRAFSWFASGEHEFKAGQVWTGKGTVKKHEIDKYTNEPVTVLSRCKLEQIEQEEEKQAS